MLYSFFKTHNFISHGMAYLIFAQDSISPSQVDTSFLVFVHLWHGHPDFWFWRQWLWWFPYLWFTPNDWWFTPQVLQGSIPLAPDKTLLPNHKPHIPASLQTKHTNAVCHNMFCTHLWSPLDTRSCTPLLDCGSGHCCGMVLSSTGQSQSRSSRQ